MNAPPKVLFVYQQLPHYRYGVFMELQRSDLIACEFAADVDAVDRSIPVIPECHFRVFRRLNNRWLGRVLWQTGLLRLIREQKYDTVVFLGNVAYLSTWIAALYCRVTRTKALFWTIGWHDYENGSKRWLRLLFYRIADALLLYSEVGREIGVALGYPRHRASVVGNSYESYLGREKSTNEVGLAGFLKKLSPIGESDEIVTAVVRIEAQRRFDLLIEAVAELNAEGRSVGILLVGAGPAMGYLSELARGLNVNLVMPGAAYSNDELGLVYGRTTITVVPRRAGLTVIQSLAYGKPVITTDGLEHQGPETAAIRPNRTGDLYVDGSIASLTSTIRCWLDRMRNDKAQISDFCRQEVSDHWSTRRHASAIVDAVLTNVA